MVSDLGNSGEKPVAWRLGTEYFVFFIPRPLRDRRVDTSKKAIDMLCTIGRRERAGTCIRLSEPGGPG